MEIGQKVYADDVEMEIFDIREDSASGITSEGIRRYGIPLGRIKTAERYQQDEQARNERQKQLLVSLRPARRINPVSYSSEAYSNVRSQTQQWVIDVLKESEKTGLTVDDIVVRIDTKYKRCQPGDKNSIAPQFSIGGGQSLYDLGDVVRIGEGQTRTGMLASLWIYKEFASAEQILVNQTQYIAKAKKAIAQKEKQLANLPAEIARLQARLNTLTNKENAIEFND